MAYTHGKHVGITTDLRGIDIYIKVVRFFYYVVIDIVFNEMTGGTFVILLALRLKYDTVYLYSTHGDCKS